jgi:hypothetical protein
MLNTGASMHHQLKEGQEKDDKMVRQSTAACKRGSMPNTGEPVDNQLKGDKKKQ